MHVDVAHLCTWICAWCSMTAMWQCGCPKCKTGLYIFRTPKGPGFTLVPIKHADIEPDKCGFCRSQADIFAAFFLFGNFIACHDIARTTNGWYGALEGIVRSKYWRHGAILVSKFDFQCCHLLRLRLGVNALSTPSIKHMKPFHRGRAFECDIIPLSNKANQTRCNYAASIHVFVNCRSWGKEIRVRAQTNAIYTACDRIVFLIKIVGFIRQVESARNFLRPRHRQNTQAQRTYNMNRKIGVPHHENGTYICIYNWEDTRVLTYIHTYSTNTYSP